MEIIYAFGEHWESWLTVLVVGVLAATVSKLTHKK